MKRNIKIAPLVFIILLISCKNSSVENSNVSIVSIDNHQTDTNKIIKTVEHKYSSDSITNIISKLNDKKCIIDSIEGFYIPKDLKDSHLVLDTMLTDSTKIFLANGGESHFGLGMYLRNNWGLWSGGRLKCYFKHKGINHPDHMSGMIIHTYAMKLNNNQINEDSIILEALTALKEWDNEMRK